jgi:uncharacterized lipoprotein NlpE involved in copper resistance
MKKNLFLLLAVFFGVVGCKNQQPSAESLKDALTDKFYIGVAMNAPQITGVDTNSVALI